MYYEKSWNTLQEPAGSNPFFFEPNQTIAKTQGNGIDIIMPSSHDESSRYIRGILKPPSHASRRRLCSEIPTRRSKIFLCLGLLQILFPISLFLFGGTKRYKGEHFMGCLVRLSACLGLIFTLFYLLTERSIFPLTKETVYVTTPAERRPTKLRHRRVQFTTGTKFFRLPKPQSKRKLQFQQPKPSFFNATNAIVGSPGSTPNTKLDYKRAHRLLRAHISTTSPLTNSTSRHLEADNDRCGRQENIIPYTETNTDKHQNFLLQNKVPFQDVRQRLTY